MAQIPFLIFSLFRRERCLFMCEFRIKKKSEWAPCDNFGVYRLFFSAPCCAYFWSQESNWRWTKKHQANRLMEATFVPFHPLDVALSLFSFSSSTWLFSASSVTRIIVVWPLCRFLVNAAFRIKRTILWVNNFAHAKIVRSVQQSVTLSLFFTENKMRPFVLPVTK